MTAQCCLTCQFWQKHRPDADYGECSSIAGIEKTLNNTSKAYVWASDPSDPGKHLSVALHTHKTFDCSQYHQRSVEQSNNIVRASQNATRKLHGLPPLGED